MALAFSGKEYEGYVSSEYIAVYAPSVSHGKATDTLNVRKGPGTSYDAITQLSANAPVDIHGRTVLSGGAIWHYIQFTKSGKAYEGYVSADYITVTSTEPLKAILVTDQETVPGGNGPLGQTVLKIVGDEKNDKRMYQKIFISGKKGDSFMANGWGSAHSVPAGEIGGISDINRKNRHFGIHINFVSADSKNDIHYAEFGADTGEWQFLSAPFVAGHDYVRVDIGFAYCRNGNIGYFDGLALYKEAFGTSFTYDKDGNVVSVTDQAKKSGKFEYDSAGNLKKMIDPKGNQFTYTYDGKHNVKTARSAANLNYAFTYDAYGNPLTSKVIHPDTPDDAKTAMTATAAYTTGAAAGQYMTSITGPEGRTLTYEWDVNKGQLLKAKNADGNEISYNYDTAGRITKVTGEARLFGNAVDMSVQYTYTNDRLAKIHHNGFDYGFTYDGFGNRKGVTIAGTTVISQTYGAKNGLLAKAVYGNGWEISYTYDSLDRVTAVTAKKDSNSYTLCSYIYDKQGHLARILDGQDSKQSCTYGYDLTDRLCEAVYDNGNAFRYTYDANDCLVKEELITADGTRTVSRTYDADSRETKFACGTANAVMAYDKIGRLSTVKRHGGKYTTTYTYKTGKDGGQTGQLTKVTNGSNTYEYQYDAAGYVTECVRNGQWRTYYGYDSQGQLRQEHDEETNSGAQYFYDAGGNMTEKRLYPRFAWDDPMHDDDYVSVTYTYDGVWKDRLASVNGQAYTYDAIGNLLSDGVHTYTWKNGRQLASVTADGMNAVYTYDANGIRTSKTVNGVKTEYLTAGGRVLSEKKGGTWQHYLYDARGQLHAIQYKGADYYYVRDGLMNIIGLVDTSGNTVVSYQYDSWGVVLGVSGSMAETLGKDNPYRYKGYYYDTEIGLYYLLNRYYDPEIGRFISADVYISTGQGLTGNNMFIYCGNNPVSRIDTTGTEWWNPMTWDDEAWMTAGSVAAIVGGCILSATGIGGPVGSMLISGGACSLIGGYSNKANGASFIEGWVGGAISGAITGGGISVGAGYYATAVEYSCANNVAGSISMACKAFAFSGAAGCIGSLASTGLSSLQGRKCDWEKAAQNAIFCATLAIGATPFAGLPGILYQQDHGILAGTLATLVVESVSDGVSYLYEQVMSAVGNIQKPKISKPMPMFPKGSARPMRY